MTDDLAASSDDDLVVRWDTAMLHNYGTPAVALVRGDGAVVTDEHGRDYVDLFAGIAVNALGHAHPAIVSAVSEQIATLGHVGNFFANPPQVALAERLLALFDRPGQVYFANSGTEANEAAFKLSRRTGRTHIVSTVDAFHGRTMGALALTGQPSKAAAFAPLPGEVTHVPYGDAGALAAAVTGDTAMVILEPIQGEAGVIPAPPGYLTAAREITEAHGALLCLDEIQTGIGRTGHWFAHQAEGVRPDVVTLAKGLGGGLPLGACVAFTDTAYGDVAALLPPGAHGSTFGGNPVCCAAGLAVLATIADEHLLDHVKTLGERIRDGVAALGHPAVAEVRGAGLLLGIVLTGAIAPATAAALRDAGFLINPCQPGVLRLAPPLTLTAEQADGFLAALPAALDAAGAIAASAGAATETATDTAGGTQ
ncbi:acetylornithine aminotransferase [Actinocatenispora sera]|uniref:Acetylornithine aminotransferase n=2 Tax=Actinocatenispora sera TaxID=390989 RepID=A0A810L5U9_9ACTN|nr:acetylornithine transaminase [Actinocatenispora sera]BCJ30275.1 acetylornithine aminotransferase [Actinocatenispora sera]